MFHDTPPNDCEDWRELPSEVCLDIVTAGANLTAVFREFVMFQRIVLNGRQRETVVLHSNRSSAHCATQPLFSAVSVGCL